MWRDPRRWAGIRGGLPASGGAEPGLARGGREGRLGVRPRRPRAGDREGQDRRPHGVRARSSIEERLVGTQTFRAAEDGEGSRVELTLEYELTSESPLKQVTDLLFIRRALRDALGRTLRRFAVEAEDEAGLRSSVRPPWRRNRVPLAGQGGGHHGSRARHRARHRAGLRGAWDEGRDRRPRRGRGPKRAAEGVPGAIGLPLDVTDRESFERFLDAADERLGNVDVLVNNAGHHAARPVRGRGRRDGPAPGGHQRARRDVRHEDRAAALPGPQRRPPGEHRLVRRQGRLPRRRHLLRHQALRGRASPRPCAPSCATRTSRSPA